LPTQTYIPMANLTLSSSAASVTFSSISQAYRDLVLVVETKASTTTGFYTRLNSDSGTNYNFVYMYGTGASTSSGSQASQNYGSLGWNTEATTTEAFMSTVQVMDYSANDKHKSLLVRSGRAGANVEALAMRYASTSAVTTMAVYPNAGTFSSGASFALYGIAS